MSRLDDMYAQREAAAAAYRSLGQEPQTTNGDETSHPDLRGNFSKGLPHDPITGLVNIADWQAFFSNFSALHAIPAGQMPFVDPLAGSAYDTEGPDAQQLALPAPPAFDSDEEIAEIAENYWMALLRDVPFASYVTHPLAAEAAAHLSTFPQFASVTPATLFRGPLAGDNAGPYLSQFMVWDVPYGAQKLPNQIAFALPDDSDYLCNWTSWINVQNGIAPTAPSLIPVTPHFISRGRDIAQYVHIDELFQAYLNACLLLITPKARGGFGAPADEGNPYTGFGLPYMENETGFGTLGEPNFKTLVAEVATRALRAVWHQKWDVHRRLRPEEYGGRLEAQRRNPALDFISAAHLTQLMPVLNKVMAIHGSWLLPQAFPEGCPMHPAYGAGHATVAGACITVLKALFQEEARLIDLGIMPLAINSGGNRLAYNGIDAADLTVLGELNKLASNIGLARNIAGVHWRTDYTNSIILGERIALYFLQETIKGYAEDVSFTVTRFNGAKVTITKTGGQTFDAYRLSAPAAMPAMA